MDNIKYLRDLSLIEFGDIINRTIINDKNGCKSEGFTSPIDCALYRHGMFDDDIRKLAVKAIENTDFEIYNGIAESEQKINTDGIIWDYSVEEAYSLAMQLSKRNGGRFSGKTATTQIILAKRLDTLGIKYGKYTDDSLKNLFQTLKLKYRDNEIIRDTKTSVLISLLSNVVDDPQSVLGSIFKIASLGRVDNSVFLTHVIKRIKLLAFDDDVSSRSNKKFKTYLKGICKNDNTKTV